MVPEIKSQLESLGVKNLPEAIITCVGGGGLAIGNSCFQGSKFESYEMQLESRFFRIVERIGTL